MNSLAKILGAATLCLVAASGGDARADRKMTCAMQGTWVDRNDGFFFNADYIEKNDPDTFNGVYSNPSAGATANVNGYALKGTWSITFHYTDPKRQGVELDMTGTGSKDAKTQILTINGTYKATKNIEKLAKSSQGGKFKLVGKCK